MEFDKAIDSATKAIKLTAEEVKAIETGKEEEEYVPLLQRLKGISNSQKFTKSEE